MRVEWDDSQEVSRSPAKKARITRNMTKNSGSRGLAKDARKSASPEHENGEDAVENDQPVVGEEAAPERRRRKGRAPVRLRPPPAQRPSWKSVPPKQRLVSDDDDASKLQDSDYEVSDLMSLLPLYSSLHPIFFLVRRRI